MKHEPKRRCQLWECRHAYEPRRWWQRFCSTRCATRARVRRWRRNRVVEALGSLATPSEAPEAGLGAVVGLEVGMTLPTGGRSDEWLKRLGACDSLRAEAREWAERGRP